MERVSVLLADCSFWMPAAASGAGGLEMKGAIESQQSQTPQAQHRLSSLVVKSRTYP